MTVDQEQDHDHDHGEMKVRQVGFIFPDDETLIVVEHVYDNATCDHGHLSAGFVGIRIHTGDEGEHDGGEHDASALLHADEALLFADRVTRAAHLVLETTEQPPDIEREVIRHTGHQDEEGIRHDS